MKNKQKIKEDGITLVALVVTIIILLILAGVTLNIALSENGIFEKAKEAVEKYKSAEEDEVNVLDGLAEQLEDINIDYNDYIGAYVEGYNPVKKTCIIEANMSGSESSQEFTTESMKWRIWDYDGKILRLISEKPTENTLTLKGANGYNNGVSAINKICKDCYSNEKQGKGVEVTNLRRSDILKIISYDYTKGSHNIEGKDSWIEVTDGTGEITYGETWKPTEKVYYPVIWEKDEQWTYKYEDGKGGSGKDQEGLIWEKEYNPIGIENNIKDEIIGEKVFKESYCTHCLKENEFKNLKYYDLVFNSESINKDYWLAGRFTRLRDGYCDFGVQYMAVHGENNNWIFRK